LNIGTDLNFQSFGQQSTMPLKYTKLIGIGGYARSGKDTVGNYLKANHDFRSVFFAEPLKEGARVMFGLTDEQLYGNDKEKMIDWLGRTPRYILQTLGTDWGRNQINDQVWLLVASRKIETLRELGYSVCVTDLRFDNEADLIREAGGTIWHVNRDNRIQVAAGAEKHASEAGLTFKPGDFRIDNNGSLDDLYAQVEDALSFS